MIIIFPSDQSKSKCGIGIWIGGGELANHRTNGLIFRYLECGGGIQVGGWCVRGRICIHWVGAVGNFHDIGKSVTIVVSVEVILGAVPVQVFNNVGDLNGEVFFDPQVVLIANFSLYGVG